MRGHKGTKKVTAKPAQKAKPKPLPPPPPPPPAPKPRLAAKTSQKAKPAMTKQKETADSLETKEPRGAGTGENAVATRDRQYNEDKEGAFPVLISPTAEQAAQMKAEVESNEGQAGGEVLQP